MKSNVLYLKKKNKTNLCSQCLISLIMQCFKRGSEAEPFNSLTWSSALSLLLFCFPQASHTSVLNLWTECVPGYRWTMCSSVCFFMFYQWCVYLNQSSTSSPRAEETRVRLYTRLHRAHPPSGGCVYKHCFFLFYHPPHPRSEMFHWASAILTHLNQGPR